MSESLHLVCPHCQSVNRIPLARLGQGGQCGRCHEPLFTARPVDVNAAAFEQQLTRSDLPLVVDFWSSWCGPCKMMAPHFAQVAARMDASARFLKVNTEQEQALAARYAIRSIPTLVILHHGREIARQSGALDAAGLQRWIGAHLPG